MFGLGLRSFSVVAFGCSCGRSVAILCVKRHGCPFRFDFVPSCVTFLGFAEALVLVMADAWVALCISP